MGTAISAVSERANCGWLGSFWESSCGAVARNEIGSAQGSERMAAVITLAGVVYGAQVFVRRSTGLSSRVSTVSL